MFKKNKNISFLLSYAIGLFIALLIFSVILLILGYDPLKAMATIPTGAFGTGNSTSETFIRFIPLLLTSLAFLIALKARFLNLGVEGQLYIGAILAYVLGAQLTALSGIIAIPLVILAGFIGGVLWLTIPLIMRTKLGINEIFPTVVMNFIAMFIVAWLTTGPLKDPDSYNARTPFLPESTWFSRIHPDYRIHVGIFFALFIALLIYLVLYKTALGYRIRAVGQNPRASQHGGINVTKGIIYAGLFSGGIAGLTGVMEIFGVHHFLIKNFSPGFGFQGIAVAALGNFHPIGVIFAAFFFAVLQIGGESMQRTVGVPVDMIYVLQAVLVLSVLITHKWVERRN